MIDYLIFVNDNGELKTITSDEIDKHRVFLAENALEDAINYILDERAMTKRIRTEIVNIPEELPPGAYEATVTRVDVDAQGNVYMRVKLNEESGPDAE